MPIPARERDAKQSWWQSPTAEDVFKAVQPFARMSWLGDDIECEAPSTGIVS